MLKTENRVGRLIELTVVTPVTIQEVGGCFTQLSALATALPGKLVLVTDARLAHTFPPEVAEALGKLMRSDNPRIQRSGLLAGESAILSMQIERMVREANNPARKVFRSRETIVAWLGEVLDVAERARCTQFLAG